ncbi:unnamed protein product [Spirodela intermedia]|uniref:Uncharacterized protein n=1 Tax=Spirodela intermedia TaxID=51605 RepID=A0A7I8KMW3_SPIIN|nr:unnamed protein product [Spirodela intermedia]CAA7398812.1 unnamed protein product [Spirodela intermedia]
MKNAAKCDTWCELQNPANHRIFERKLRPRPSGRGHACLGVTPRADAEAGRRARARGGPKRSAPRAAASGGSLCSSSPRPPSVVGEGEEERRTEPRRERGATPAGPAAVGPRPQVRRGHPPSLSI